MSRLVLAAIPVAAIVAWAVRRGVLSLSAASHAHDPALVATMLRAIEAGEYSKKEVLDEFLTICFELAADDPAAPVLQRTVAVCAKMGGAELRQLVAEPGLYVHGSELQRVLQPLARVQQLAKQIDYGQKLEVCSVQRRGIEVRDASISELPEEPPLEMLLDDRDHTVEANLERLHERVTHLPVDSPASLPQARAELIELVAEIRHEEAVQRKALASKAILAFKAAGSRQKTKQAADFLGAMGLHREGSAASRNRDNADALAPR